MRRDTYVYFVEKCKNVSNQDLERSFERSESFEEQLDLRTIRSKTMNLKTSYLFPENRSKMEIERSILDFEKKNQDDEDLHHKNVFSSNNDFIHQQNVCSSKNTK